MRLSLKNQIWLLFSFSSFVLLSFILFLVFHMYHQDWINQEKLELVDEFEEIENGGKKKLLEEIEEDNHYIYLPEKNYISNIAKEIPFEATQISPNTIGNKVYIFQKFQSKDFGTIILGEDVSKYQDAEKMFSIILIKISLLLFLLLVFIGWIFSRIAVRPVQKLQENLQKIKPDKLSDYKFIKSFDQYDELSLLEKSFQGLLRKIQKYQGQQKEFIYFTSHELRTPLTSLKTSLELAKKYPEKYQEAIEEVEFLTKLIDQLLLLTKIDNNSYKKEGINLSNLIEKKINKYKKEILGKNRKLVIKIRKEVKIKTNSELFVRVIENLIENSIKFTPDHGKIIIYLKNNKLTISNSNKNKINIEKLTEAFYQDDSSRFEHGTGLGLYYVDKCLNAMNHTLSFESRNNNFLVSIGF